jgi:hypothetical protein
MCDAQGLTISSDVARVRSIQMRPLLDVDVDVQIGIFIAEGPSHSLLVVLFESC